MTRESIADKIIELAKQAAEWHVNSGRAIESMSDEVLPAIDNAGTYYIIQDAFESYAYTWLDSLRGGISEHEISSDIKNQLMSLPLENYSELAEL